MSQEDREARREHDAYAKTAFSGHTTNTCLSGEGIVGVFGVFFVDYPSLGKSFGWFTIVLPQNLPESFVEVTDDLSWFFDGVWNG